MLIGDVAKRAGLSKDGVRHYESLGLIHSRNVKAGSRSYRSYDESTLERLSLIALAKRLHFSLREIAAVLDLVLSDKISSEERSRILVQKVAEIDAKIADLQQARKELLAFSAAPHKEVVDAYLSETGLLVK